MRMICKRMDTIRYGIIGIKGVGGHHLRQAMHHDTIELTALADIDASAVEQQASDLGVRSFTDYRALLDADVVDAVSIATPHNLHGTIGLDCLEAGTHIFVEKPLANRVSEADAMLKAAHERGLKICVGHQYRTYQVSQRMKHLIDTGTIGNLQRLLWTWLEFRPAGYYTRDVWRTTWEKAGGGVLMNQTSHDLDLICWLAGQPVQVSAMLGNQLHPHMEVEDIACATVRFANGALGSFQGSVNQPSGYSVRQLAGDRGVMVIQDVRSLTGDLDDQILLGTYEDPLPEMTTKLTQIAAQPEIAWETLLPTERSDDEPSGHTLLLDSFIESILTDGTPLVTGESARVTVEFINAIILSAMKKKTVDLPLDPAEYDDLFEALVCGEQMV